MGEYKFVEIKWEDLAGYTLVDTHIMQPGAQPNGVVAGLYFKKALPDGSFGAERFVWVAYHPFGDPPVQLRERVALDKS